MANRRGTSGQATSFVANKGVPEKKQEMKACRLNGEEQRILSPLTNLHIAYAFFLEVETVCY